MHVPRRGGAYYPVMEIGELELACLLVTIRFFGPIASIICAKDVEDAMRLANEPRYDLGGGVFSKNEEHALKLARNHFDTGMIRINSSGAADANMPFGGVKDSDYGRGHDGFGMIEFVNAKTIFMP